MELCTEIGGYILHSRHFPKQTTCEMHSSTKNQTDKTRHSAYFLSYMEHGRQHGYIEEIIQTLGVDHHTRVFLTNEQTKGTTCGRQRRPTTAVVLKKNPPRDDRLVDLQYDCNISSVRFSLSLSLQDKYVFIDSHKGCIHEYTQIERKPSELVLKAICCVLKLRSRTLDLFFSGFLRTGLDITG